MRTSMGRLFSIALLLAATLPAAPLILKVQISSPPGIVEIPLETYVAAVLAGESGGFQSSEALKAMAVAARTYAVRMRGRHSAEGFDLCDTTHCQRLDRARVTARIEAAVSETAGELLWYAGKPAFTPYTRDCGGRTEDAAAVWPDLAAPYLKSHQDPWCTRQAGSHWQISLDSAQIAGALARSSLRTPGHIDRISILDRTPSGRASKLLLSGPESIRISASSFRFAIGRELGWNTIQSDNYDVRSANGRSIFEGTGSGHGVGLCQRGAEAMGLAGRSYHEILDFYYPGAIPGLNGQGVRWQRLGGETISLLTTQPEKDASVLSAAERIGRSLAARTGWAVPPKIEIRAYPDLDTFRNATAEPGWVAAHTDGLRIHMQPIALLRSSGVLESTLSHELVHVMIESRAAPGLPIWFREGLADFLEQRRVTDTSVARIPAETDLRQTSDPARARKAYADASAMVAHLVRNYGETAVLGWVGRGLPSGVTDASSSHAPPKSR
jgi:stage II sporulation protein D